MFAGTADDVAGTLVVTTIAFGTFCLVGWLLQNFWLALSAGLLAGGLVVYCAWKAR